MKKERKYKKKSTKQNFDPLIFGPPKLCIFG